MQFFVGIDVSLDSSSICVIDERGVIIKEGKTDSDPAAIARFVRHKGRKIALLVGGYDRGVDWGALMAAAVMSLAPMLILFLLLQRRFISFITHVALKG